jgi:glycosyltransferase involved in cell wall biosynthesis
MRIAVEIQPVLEEYLTGVGEYTDNLIKRFKAHANENDQIYLLGMDFFRKAHRVMDYQAPNITVHTNGLMHYGIYRRLWHWLPFIDYGRFFGIEADIYHFVNFVVPPYVKGKVLVTVYDMVYKLFPETMERANYKKLEKNLARSCARADAVITISQNSKEEIIKHLGVSEEKVLIIYPGVDLARYHNGIDRARIDGVLKKYALPDAYFLYLGTLEPRKNIETIVEAYRLYSKNHGGDIKMVIAGRKGWQYGRIFDKVREYGLEDRVIFPGYVSEEDKPGLYAGAQAFLFPSLYEGFGMPPLEAMACGTPVIVAAASSLPEVVGDAGCMVEPMDAEAIAGYMHALASDREYSDSLRLRGFERAKQFSWDKSVEALFKVYRGLMP